MIKLFKTKVYFLAAAILVGFFCSLCLAIDAEKGYVGNRVYSGVAFNLTEKYQS